MEALGVNYYARFGLEYDPFIKNSKEFFVETSEAKEVLKMLKYLQARSHYDKYKCKPKQVEGGMKVVVSAATIARAKDLSARTTDT